jgi:hypothetical protein
MRTVYQFVEGRKVTVALDEAPVLDSRLLSRRRGRARRRAAKGGRSCYREDNPGRSLSMGCHRSQIGLMNDTLKQHGITDVHYEPDKHGGKCVITGNSKKTGRRAWMKIFGQMHGLGKLHDADSFD